MKKYYIYWIKAKFHIDPFTEGYIGLSSQPHIRFKSHTTDNTNAGSKIVKEFIQENGLDSIELQMLEEFNLLEDAIKSEIQYRPENFIGWNHYKGGTIPPDNTGRKDSFDTIQKRKTNMLATKKARKSLNPDIYQNIWKGKTGRYTEEQRKHIGSFHKGKIISEEHKQACRDKLSRGNSVYAKRTAIKDLETGVITIFHSISQIPDYLPISQAAAKSAKRDYLTTGRLRLIKKRYQLVPEQGED